MLTALCNAYDSNELAAAAVALVAGEKKAYPFLLQFAFQEVKATLSEGTLFRTDCIFTKTTIAWLKLIQAHYDLLKKVCTFTVLRCVVCAVLCCVVWRCFVLCCAVLCCAVLRCAVWCCVALCCVVVS